jgi:hypothetical protein
MNFAVLDQGNFKKVDTLDPNHLAFPSSRDLFSMPSNLIPGIHGVAGGRSLIGAKASLQSIPLIHRERPLVESSDTSDKHSTQENFGRNYLSVTSKKSGVVNEVSKNHIKINNDDGTHNIYQLYNNFNLGRKSFISHQAIVIPGHKVKANEILATSNYTDNHGNMALGVNLTTAIMPFRSHNFEDAYAVTESGAKKLIAEQMIKFHLEKKFGVDTGKDKFVSLFPNKYTNTQIASIDSDGVIKPGTKLHTGDPVILAFSPRALKSTDLALGKLSKVLKHAFKDNSEIWDYEHPGEVVDVAKHGELITIHVKTERSLLPGDKIGSIFGAKGVATIVPDSQAPTMPDGRPVDIMLNSMSITSRVAPALAASLGLGKLAKHKGTTIKMDQFRKDSSIQNVINTLDKNKIKDTEQLYDPTTGRYIEAVVGPLYYNRLAHISEDKLSTRSQGTGYCFDNETEVLTKRGWVSWPLVKNNDLFFTTGDFKHAKFSKAAEIIRQHYSGEMYGFHGKGIEYLVTPEHKFIIENENGNKTKKTAKKFHGSRGKFIKSGMILNPTKPKDIVIPSIKFKKKHRIEIKINSYSFAKFIGIWISEGSVRYDEVENRYRVYVWQDQKANPKKYNKIYKMLNCLPFNWNIHKGSDGINKGFYTDSPELARYLITNIGKSCKKKRIPEWLLNSTQRHRLLTLKYLIMGDGNKYSADYNYYTYSKDLADSVQQLCILSGLYAAIHPYKYEKNINVQYVVTITKSITHYLRSQNNLKYKNFYVQPYDGMVYCARIPETETLYVRKNGKCFLSHNSFDLQPSKIAGESSKRIGNLGTTALLSHDVKNVLEDIGTVKGTKNDEFWRALKLGQTPPAPKVPFIFNKFIASLQAAGINVTRQGNVFNILPLTDKDTIALSNGEIKKATMFKPHHEELIHEPGGLFDPIHVGILGDRFNHISLTHPVPNPISEDYLRKLLGVTKIKYNEMVTTGEISKQLNNINIDGKIAEMKKYIESGKRTKRDDAVKILEFLLTLKQKGIHPKDLMIHKVPILPAMYRPASKMGEVVLTSDVNNLYKDLILNNNSLKNTEGVPDEVINKLKQNQYNGIKAVFGLGDPINKKHTDKNVKGLLATMLGLKGGTAKSTMFQSKVVNKSLDLVGRAVLTPDTRLDVDQASVPQDLLWQVYKPFIIRRLVMKGISALQAVDYAKKHSPLAVQALKEEMEIRPGIVTRDPAWHKFNLMGFHLLPNPNPKDKTLKLNPLVFRGFGADNDGDQLNIHIPATEAARKEVLEKMMPSKNLLSAKSFSPILIPSNESALGLYSLSTEKNNKAVKKFKTETEVVRAYQQGHLTEGDHIEIG